MNRIFVSIIIFLMFASCEKQPEFQQETVNQAIENGKISNEGYVRSLHFVEGWLTKTDSASGLTSFRNGLLQKKGRNIRFLLHKKNFPANIQENNYWLGFL